MSRAGRSGHRKVAEARRGVDVAPGAAMSRRPLLL